MVGARKILSVLVVSVLVIGGLTVVVSEASAAQEGKPVSSVKLSVELDMEEAVGAVYEGEYDLFMYSVDGPVYQGLREEWRRALDTWEVRGSYNNLFLNPAHEGKNTTAINEAQTEGWIDDPADLQWLANDKNGDWTVNPFAHNDIRFAMQYLNRKKMVDEVLDGFGEPRYSFIEFPDSWTPEHSPIEKRYGIDPEGDRKAVERIVEEAMMGIKEDVAFGDVRRENDVWQYRPSEGDWHEIKIEITTAVVDGRKKLGEHMVEVLRDLGFNADFNIERDPTFPPVEPYDNLDRHIFIGGWTSSKAEYYQEAKVSKFYAPWYGFMHTYDPNNHWNYDEEGYDNTIGPSQRARDYLDIPDDHANKTVEEFDIMAEELFAGQVETKEEYWDKKMGGEEMGFEEAVRVVLVTKHAFYPYNPDRLLSSVPESVNGYDTYFGPRTMRTDDGVLDTAVYTGEDRSFMDNWNLYGGSDDVYGEYTRRMAREYGSWNHPQTGLPMEVNCYWSEGRDTDPYERQGDVETDYEYDQGELIENIEIPETAVDYVPGIEVGEDEWNVTREWWARDELIAEGLIEDEYAAVKATIDVHEEHVWHDGTNFTLQDVMANYAREKELGNPASEPYLASHDDQSTPWWDSIHAIEWDEENGTYTVYGDYTFPMDDKVGDHYAMFPEAHPLTYEGWDHLHGATEIYAEAGIGESYDYEPGTDNWIHQLSLEQNDDLVTIMETIIAEEYLPPYLDGNNSAPIPMKFSQLETELNSLIDFINEHDHSFISTGPFYIEDYTEENNFILERWDHYGYPFEGEEAEGVELPYGYWAAQFDVQETRLNNITASTTVTLGEDFDAEGTGHYAHLYPEHDEVALTEDNMDDYRFTLRKSLGGEIVKEISADEIELKPQDGYSEFFATISTDDIDRGGHYTLQLEVKGADESTYTTIDTTVIVETKPIISSTLTVPEEVVVGETQTISASVYQGSQAMENASLYIDDEQLIKKPISANDEVTFETEYTFEEFGEIEVKLRADEDWALKEKIVKVLEGFDLSVDIEGKGEVEYEEKEQYVEGTEVNLTAVPEEGWNFVEWTGDYEGTEEEITVTMDEDKNITAHFVEEVEYYELNIDVEGEGEVEIDPDQDEYENGTEVNLILSVGEGWKFVNWSGDYEGEEEEITITMDENKTITAVFEEEEKEEEDDIFGFTLAILALAIFVSAVIYYRKSQQGDKWS